MRIRFDPQGCGFQVFFMGDMQMRVSERRQRAQERGGVCAVGEGDGVEDAVVEVHGAEVAGFGIQHNNGVAARIPEEAVKVAVAGADGVV